MRLDRFVKKRYPKLPIGLVFKFLRKRKITLDGKRADAATRLKAAQTVLLWEDLQGYALPEDQHLRQAARAREGGHYKKNFRVLYEDEVIIVVNKPVGIVVHPGPKHHKGDTLLDLLRVHLPEAFAPESTYQPGFVHRLDRATSGVLMAAKTREAAKSLEAVFRTRLAHKKYLALVTGQSRHRRGRIEDPLIQRRTPDGISRFVAVRDKKKLKALAGKMQSARTMYEVRETFESTTLLEVETESGRTHQIRAHLASIGLPLAGDGDYGERLLNRKLREKFGLERLFLHAARIEIPHPSSGKPVEFTAPLPDELDRVVQRLHAATEKSQRR